MTVTFPMSSVAVASVQVTEVESSPESAEAVTSDGQLVNVGGSSTEWRAKVKQIGIMITVRAEYFLVLLFLHISPGMPSIIVPYVLYNTKNP